MEQMFFPVTQKKAAQSGIGRSSEANKNALFPTQLRNLRKEKGVSQEELSKILGVSKSTLGLWETGDTLPDARSLHDLAVYYGVSTDYLLGISDIKTTNVTIKGIAEYTGLTELSIDFLHWLASEGNDIYSPRELINELLGRDAFNMNLADALDEFCNGAHDAAQPNKDLMIARGEIPDDMKVSQIEWTDRISSQELAMLKIEHAKSEIIRILDTIAREHRQTKK